MKISTFIVDNLQQLPTLVFHTRPYGLQTGTPVGGKYKPDRCKIRLGIAARRGKASQ